MPGLFIIAHAPLASALKQAAGHCFPEMAEQVQVLDVPPNLPCEALEAQASVLLKAAQAIDPRGEALILTDVFGATPCNTVQRLAEGAQVRVVTGVNVPMLWRVLNYASEPLDAVVSRALSGGTQGVMQVACCAPPTSDRPSSSHDQDHRHHQQ